MYFVYKEDELLKIIDYFILIFFTKFYLDSLIYGPKLFIYIYLLKSLSAIYITLKSTLNSA